MALCLRSRITCGCKGAAALLQLLHEAHESAVMYLLTWVQDMEMHCHAKLHSKAAPGRAQLPEICVAAI